MKFRSLKSPLLFYFVLTLVGCDSHYDRPQPVLGETAKAICDLKSWNSSSDERVTVRGNVGGYHEVFLFSKDCSGGSHFIELQLSDSQKDLLRTLNRDKPGGSPDFKGEITVSGTVVLGAGRLYTYPGRKIDAANEDRIEPMIVDRLIDVAIEEVHSD